MKHSYLKLIQNKIQDLSELVARTLHLDVTVVDATLRRIAGTGDFFERINTSSPQNSIFAEVIKTGKPAVNRDKDSNATCLNCPNFSYCIEKKNITYPIMVDSECLGVVSLACFSEEQLKNLEEREEECKSLLSYMVNVIESEIRGIERNNKIIKHQAEINEVINCIDKGIFIVDEESLIFHVNSSAIHNLDLNLSKEAIINTQLKRLLSGIKLNIPENLESLAFWRSKDKKFKVIYKVNRIFLEGDREFFIITFDTIEEMISKVINYQDREVITFSSIIGRSEAFEGALNVAKIAASSDSTVLISGDSGTGKELFARSIHNESYRRNGPFIAVNCAGLPEALIESELFGYVKGSFTGADPKGKIGKFEAAEGGTILLDEITEIPLHLQAKLLRVLQERSVVPVGAIDSRVFNARIIAATNKDVAGMVRENRFRLDLYYRLNIIPIQLPVLASRREDIPLLAEYILKTTLKRMNRRKITFGEEVEQLFLEYQWPGNIRELENVIEYAVNFCRDDRIAKEHLPAYVLAPEFTAIPDSDVEASNDMRSAVTETEREIITRYLDIYGDSTESKKRIAAELDISLTTLYRKLKKTAPYRS